MNILLVEDDEMLRKSLAYYLQSKDFTVEAFDNGSDAISYISENAENLDLVITDLNLPFAGGRQVLQEVKQLSQEIPVIVLTSSGVEATELEIFELGADEFVTKPFSPPVLLKRINKLVVKQ
jgi:DNA-binding response OmpR family regulator